MDKNNVQNIMIWCIVAVVVVVLLYVIICLISEHIEETKKAKEYMNDLEPVGAVNNISIREQNSMQMPINNSGQFYASVGRFTDTGRPMTQSQYNGMNTTFYDDVQFVIVKSLIHTETREEIE